MWPCWGGSVKLYRKFIPEKCLLVTFSISSVSALEAPSFRVKLETCSGMRRGMMSTDILIALTLVTPLVASRMKVSLTLLGSTCTYWIFPVLMSACENVLIGDCLDPMYCSSSSTKRRRKPWEGATLTVNKISAGRLSSWVTCNNQKPYSAVKFEMFHVSLKFIFVFVLSVTCHHDKMINKTLVSTGFYHFVCYKKESTES